jgi:glycosyltransferase involved in cell wall biosynthesis
MSKVAVLAVLANFEASYSVAGVTLAYVKLLRRMGHEVVFVTTSDFTGGDKLPVGVEVRTYKRYQGKLDEIDIPAFDAYVRPAATEIAKALRDCSVCLTHDVIFLKDFVAVNWAARIAAESLPHLRWLHWIHSAPSPRPQKLEYPLSACYCDMPRSEFVCVNRTDVPRVRDMYAVPEGHVRTVHNFVDPVGFLDLHPLTAEFYEQYRLYDADTICVYPTRLVVAKQVDKTIKLLSRIKALGQQVRLFVCNSYSNAEPEKKLAGKLRTLAESVGLGKDECVITSLVKSKWAGESGHNIELGVPNRVVCEMLQLADLFVLPSISEACSVIMLEASITKNLMVLNRDLLTTPEFLGQELDPEYTKRGLALSFGSLTRPISGYLPSEESWFEDRARAVVAAQERNQALQFFKYVRKYHSPEWVYRNQLLPLIEPDKVNAAALGPDELKKLTAASPAAAKSRKTQGKRKAPSSASATKPGASRSKAGPLQRTERSPSG